MTSSSYVSDLTFQGYLQEIRKNYPGLHELLDPERIEDDAIEGYLKELNSLSWEFEDQDTGGRGLAWSQAQNTSNSRRVGMTSLLEWFSPDSRELPGSALRVLDVLGGSGTVARLSATLGNNAPTVLTADISNLMISSCRAQLDAGCGEGAEAIWLASRGWQVTAADISSAVLARAAERGTSERLRWVEADLGSWAPDTLFDLVTTHYAHPAMPQLDFYDRVAGWVARGGTLLIVGHLQSHDGHRQHAPAEASATAAAITARLDEAAWEVVTAEECRRTLTSHDGREVPLHDVVVRATRRP